MLVCPSGGILAYSQMKKVPKWSHHVTIQLLRWSSQAGGTSSRELKSSLCILVSGSYFRNCYVVASDDCIEDTHKQQQRKLMVLCFWFLQQLAFTRMKETSLFRRRRDFSGNVEIPLYSPGTGRLSLSFAVICLMWMDRWVLMSLSGWHINDQSLICNGLHHT